MRRTPIPTKRLIFLFILTFVLMLVGVFIPILKDISFILDFIIILAFITDLLYVSINSKLEISVPDNQTFNIGNNKDFIINIKFGGIAALNTELGVDLPTYWDLVSNNIETRLHPGENKNYSIVVKPFRRGYFNINQLHYRTSSYIGLCYLYHSIKIDKTLVVYPDFSGIKDYLKLGRSNRLYEVGIHKNRNKGQGTELESLREYNRDDDAKFIDWKATSRLNRPVTKQFHIESQNEIVIAMDCGRIMCSEQNKFSSLDYAINGVLTLSHVAIGLGDSLRIITFSDKIEGDLKCAKGKDQFNKITKFLTPIQPKFVESNYNEVFSYLTKTTGKRALVIFISDILDDINYNLFKKNFINLSKRHQILFLLLRDTLVEKSSFGNVDNRDDLFNIAVSRELYLKRDSAINKLRVVGIDILDLLPTEVTGKLVDRYLYLKSRNKL